MRSSWLWLLALCACDTYRFYHDTTKPNAITDGGPQWEELAGSASGLGLNQGAAADLNVAVDAAGNPTVAWSDSDGAINVHQWNGSAWIDLGFPNTPGPSAEAHVAIDATGRVVVAWTEGGAASGEIYAQRLESGVWHDLGNVSSTPAQQSFQPHLAVGAEPVIAWLELSGSYEIFAAHYDGASWQPYGSFNVSNDADTDWDPAVAVGPDDNPCVAWTDNQYVADLRLVCWSGLAWQTRGNSLGAGGITPAAEQAWEATIAIDQGGQPWLGYRSDGSGAWEAYVQHFDGAHWTGLGGSPRVSPDEQASDQGVMALDHTGTPVVAWTEAVGGGTAIYASTWDGTRWTELAGSLTDGGVSGIGNMTRPSIAASADGTTVIAWLAGTIDSPRVYLRRLR